MRILFLSQLVPYPPDAGAKVRSYNVLQYLQRAGHDVTLVAFARPSDQAAAINHLQRLCTAVYTVPMIRSRLKDAWYFGRSVLTGEPFLIARDRVPAMHALLSGLLAARPFDAVHVDQLWMAPYALAIRQIVQKQGGSIQLVLDQHNAVYMIPNRMAETSRPPVRALLQWEARKMKRFELATCARFDHTVWVTDEDRLALGPRDGEMIGDLTIPICIDAEQKSVIQRQPNAHRVTFLGGLHWPPNAAGIAWFVHEVWPRIQTHLPQATLTIIGKNPPRLLTSSDPPITQLDITGYVADVTSYLAETAAFIVPLHAGGGMRVKIIDAWAWGLPVVSTTIGAEGIDYQDGTNLLIGDDPPSFARAVCRLLEQPDLGEAIGRVGRQTAETCYDWRRVYCAWDQVYPPPAGPLHFSPK
ncbi:MAG: glycosyltransferase family 4 protein [Ardenticatenaceae bacterium]|nr:glycosyltransferase family 4 protein [Ardenticatenaceae bacterium]